MSSTFINALLMNNSVPAGPQYLTPVILVTWEVEIRRVTVPDQPEQKVHETPTISTEKVVWWHTSVVPATARSKNGRIMV
jgi:hypothetical protein